MDTEVIGTQSHNWNYQRRLLKRSWKFLIFGAVLTAIGTPLTIWGYKFSQDSFTSDDTDKDSDSPATFVLSHAPMALGMSLVGGGIMLLVFALVNRLKCNRLVRKSASWQLFMVPISPLSSSNRENLGVHFRYTF